MFIYHNAPKGVGISILNTLNNVRVLRVDDSIQGSYKRMLAATIDLDLLMEKIQSGELLKMRHFGPKKMAYLKGIMTMAGISVVQLCPCCGQPVPTGLKSGLQIYKTA